MRVIELQNIQREEGQIFYLRKYTCDAVMEFPTSTDTVQIYFSIETSPMGKKIIELSFPQPINYPLIPVKKGTDSSAFFYGSKRMPLFEMQQFNFVQTFHGTSLLFTIHYSLILLSKL